MSTTYTPDSLPKHKVVDIYVDGRQIFGAVAVNPVEGWVDVAQFSDGRDPFTFKPAGVLMQDSEPKRYRGNVVITIDGDPFKPS